MGNLLAISICAHCASAHAQPYPIPAGSIVQWVIGTCDYPGGDPRVVTRGVPPHPKPCVQINTPPQPASPFAVTFIAPKGAIEFQFQVSLLRYPAKPAMAVPTDATYTVTVTATDSSGNSTTGSGTTTLRLATEGSTHAILKIPINIEAAEATISFQYSLSQNPGGPVTPQPRDSGHGSYKLAVTPIAAFQLPAVPIAILYAPLGDKGTSSLTFTSITGTSVQVTKSQTTSTAASQDNATTLSAGLSYGLGKKEPKTTFGFTDSTTWDSSVEGTDSHTYDQSNSIVTADQVNMVVGLTAASFIPAPVSLTQLSTPSTSNQPFWHDQFLLAVNAQYAIWDYPSGPIVQPKGNVHVTEVSVAELDNCSNGVSGPIEIYPSVILTAQDCTNILLLDQFWVEKRQSALPKNNRILADFGTTSSFTISNTQEVTSSVQTSIQASFESKATSTRTNSLAATGNIPIPHVPGLALKVEASATTTKTTVQSATISYENVDSKVCTKSFTASTSVEDTDLTGGSFRATIKLAQDLNFQGVAVSDTAMNWQQNAHMKKIIGTRYVGVELSTLPVIRSNESTADAPTIRSIRPQRYAKESGYDRVVITEPNAQQKAAARAQAQQLFSAASKRHFQRTVPKPTPVAAVPISTAEAVTFMNRLPVQKARVQEFTDALKGSGK
jgi:hypothetical protein